MKRAPFRVTLLALLITGIQAHAEPTKPVAPAFAKAGTRVVFFEGSGTIANAGQKWVPGGNGQWTINGQSVKPEDVGASAGGGYIVLDVGHVDDKTSSLVATRYGLMDPQQGLVIPILEMGPTGDVAPHWDSAKYWRDPAELAAMNVGTVGGVTVLRMKYPLNDTVYDAVRLCVATDSGGSIDTYDRKTGLLLFSSLITATTGPLVTGEGQGAFGVASTSIAVSKLISVRDVKLPWTDMDAPDWTAKVKSIHFKNDMEQSPYPGAPALHIPSESTFEITTRAPRAIAYDIVIPGAPQKLKMAHGSGMHLGVFLPPAVFPKLKPMQLLDEDKTLGVKLWCQAIDDRSVTLVEGNSLFHTQFVYDLQGMMTRMECVISMAPGQHTFKMQRTSAR